MRKPVFISILTIITNVIKQTVLGDFAPKLGEFIKFFSGLTLHLVDKQGTAFFFLHD